MASPAIGGGNPKMPKQTGMKIQPVIPGGKKPKQPNWNRQLKLKQLKLGKDKPYPMPRIEDDMMHTQPFPGPGPYRPIKQTKSVGKVYKTY